MKMKLKDLIKLLATKEEHLEQDVEYIVLTKDEGQIVVMNVEANAKDIIKVLKHFGK